MPEERGTYGGESAHAESARKRGKTMISVAASRRQLSLL